MYPPSVVLFCIWGALLLLLRVTTAAESSSVLLWSSTGGGWRAMFADMGYAHAFQRAGLFTENSTRFDGVATVSGASWFSTQLFYSQAFYNQTVLAETPDQLREFVIRWMESYYEISTDIDDETKIACNTSDLTQRDRFDPNSDFAKMWQDVCHLLYQYDFDWALFIQTMLNAAATDYGDASFVDTVASPTNRILPLSQTNLLVLAALAPNSRIRVNDTAVYLGHNGSAKADNGNDEADLEKLFSTVLSASYVVQDSGSQFWFGSDDRTSQLHTYLAKTPPHHSWSHWSPFFLFPGNGGTIEINNTHIGATPKGVLQTPYGGPDATTVLQIASISSAAAGNGSPLAPSVFTQTLSIGYYRINEAKVRTVWRVLAGLAAGLGAGIFFYVLVAHFLIRWPSDFCDKQTYRNVGICSGIAGAIGIGLVTGLVYGLGSIVVPNLYDEGTGNIYQNPNFDNFAVCSQWPNSCGEQDGVFIDGWFIDNPAFVVNVGHHQQSGILSPGEPLKVIITNTNESWNTTFNYAQFLQYYSTDFNQGVPSGGFLWAPGYFAPYRSPQLFEEYLDEAGLDALLVPISGSNMTTALLKGTTIDNPSFNVTKGQTVDILLLNLNEEITTFVVGAQVVKDLTEPLANMTAHIASSEELVKRVRDFVYS